jgi:hypothetical protein
MRVRSLSGKPLGSAVEAALSTLIRKASGLRRYRLAGFDFASSEVNEALTRQLHRCEFLEGAYNVVLVGGPESAS